uniref:zinc finger protein OZF-like n=1 Tax=Ciona intestinalis TaxID=7719 RepID=UPI0002B8EA4F|nr:zinc finger protein OZF-like [Ciona intestinalis]|eukprot:XP_004226399.1 zinc finger protein OZF-like [Ciona intestinalis]
MCEQEIAKFSVGQRVLSAKKTYECCFCDRKLSSKRNLRQHEYIHTGLKPFPCQKCGLAFAQRGTLARHAMKHLDKQFECRFCGKKLSTNSSLKVHEAIHSGIKPHVCGVCGKAYVQKVNLLYHIRRKLHGSEDHEREMNTTL